MKKAQYIHFVGIGGIGMSAIARVVLADGHIVSGSDLKLSPITEKLTTLGARIFEGHKKDNLGIADLVVTSSAVPEDNPELEEARQRGIPILKRAAMLATLMEGRVGIAIAGTHGKTTTTALIAFILEEAGLDPTILIGGELIGMESNAKLGKGRFLVAEADEFDESFLHLRPTIAVVTNIDSDHLDYYGSFPAILGAFDRFVSSVPAGGSVVICGDDPGTQQILLDKYVTYGLAEGMSWRAKGLRSDGQGYQFSIDHNGHSVGEFATLLPGKHNVYNALAAIAVSSLLNVSVKTVRRALASFKGVHRRIELKGEKKGITIIDDYAHHPTEIKATLEAIREKFDHRRLVCIFQPHTYSRTRLLMNEFARCFDMADEVLITDIYAAREQDPGDVRAEHLAQALVHPSHSYVGDLNDAITYLLKHLRPGDVLLTAGAGDVDRVGDEVLKRLEAK